MKKGSKRFVKVRCGCGCNKFYLKDLKPPKPSGWVVTNYTNEKHPKPLEIKRLTDGGLFRVGSNVKLFTATGKLSSRGVIASININSFLQIAVYAVGKNRLGTYYVHNEQMYYNSADDPTLFNYMQLHK